MKRTLSKKGFKDGAASFYVVAFSTLILVIIATSFATAIIAEITRTANDELSQSAYDAALAGAEDAKLAFLNYQNCVKRGVTYSEGSTRPTGNGPITCQDIVWWMNNPDCDMVAHILGRIGKDDTGEVLIEETTSSGGAGSNSMNQAYTCVEMRANLANYQATLSSSNPYQVIKVRLGNASANDIEAVRVSWYTRPAESNALTYANFLFNENEDAGRVTFMPITGNNVAAAPPTIAVQLIQTSNNFTFSETISETVNESSTNRATVYLVPSNKASGFTAQNFINIYSEGLNSITPKQMASTNNLEKNLPFVTYCPPTGTNDFVCSATLNLPSPIIDGSEKRSDDTFMMVVSLPYGQPETDFSLEFLCVNDCGGAGSNVATLANMQVMVDSTGRANDLYRRVEMRMESASQAVSYPFYALELVGGDSNQASLVKTMSWPQQPRQ